MIDVIEVNENEIFKYSVVFDLMEKSVDGFSVFIEKLNDIKTRKNFETFITPPLNEPFPSEICKYNDCIYSATFSVDILKNKKRFHLAVWWKEKADE